MTCSINAIRCDNTATYTNNLPHWIHAVGTRGHIRTCLMSLDARGSLVGLWHNNVPCQRDRMRLFNCTCSMAHKLFAQRIPSGQMRAQEWGPCGREWMRQTHLCLIHFTGGPSAKIWFPMSSTASESRLSIIVEEEFHFWMLKQWGSQSLEAVPELHYMKKAGLKPKAPLDALLQVQSHL